MKTLEIYDPALCCSSGVCGPSPDQILIDFAGTIEALKTQGIEAKRFNLAQEPMAFVQNATAKDILTNKGETELPLVFVNGELKFSKSYPTLRQLQQALGLAESEAPKLVFIKTDAPKAFDQGSCCDSSTGCC
jgi:arsenite-transporting ATPase